MKRSTKVVLAALAVVLAILVAVAAYFAWRYLAYPPVDRATMAKTMADLQAVAAEVENRPAADREMLVDLLFSNASWLDTADIVAPGYCPAYADTPPHGYLANRENLARFDRTLDEVFRDGLALRDRATADSRIMVGELITVRLAGVWHAATFVWSEEPSQALQRGMALSRGLFEARFLVTAMLAIGNESNLLLGVVHRLPRLTGDQRREVAAILRAAPPAAMAVVEAMRVETALLAGTEAFDQWASDVPDQTLTDKLIDGVVGFTNWYEREMAWFAYFMNRQLDRAAVWAAAGAEGEPPIESPLVLAERAPLAAIAVPNLADLLSKGADQQRRRGAILEAIRLLNEHDGAGGTIMLDYDDDNVLVVTPAYGCLQPRETPAVD
jgi:hypothetical protein